MSNYEASQPALSNSSLPRPAAGGLRMTLYRADIEALWAHNGGGAPDETSPSAPPNWLSVAERRVFQALRVPKRCRDWLAGRYTAKWALCDQLIPSQTSWDRIEILSTPEGPEHGRPRVIINGQVAPVDVSISHSGRVVIAGAVAQPGIRLGIDVEHIAERAESFEALALTPGERRALGRLSGRARAQAVTQRWALKESLVKATGTGLRARLTDLDIFAILKGSLAVPHTETGHGVSVAGWGSEVQGDMIYTWVALKNDE